MKLLTRARQFFHKHFSRDRDHGGWVNVSAPWNFWQMDLNVDGGNNNVVYSCVQAYAQTIAQLPAKHRRELPEGGYDIIKTSALHRVLRKPNAYQTRSDFLLNLIHSLKFRGSAYAFAVRNNKFEISELHLLNPDKIHPLVSPDGSVFYHVSPDAISGAPGAMLLPARDVLHVRLHCPHDPLIGVTPIYAAALSVAANNSMMGHTAQFFEQMSRPSGVLTTDEKLTADQTKQLRERWEEHSKGLNSGKVPILGWGIKWQPLSITSTDAQMIDQMKFSVEEIARAFRIPLPLIGVTDGATYNNVFNLLTFWKASGLGFVIEHIEQAIADLFRLPDGQEVHLDTDNLLRTDMQTRVDALTKGITGGLYAPNEARKKEGLKPVEGGDMPRVQQQMVPLDYEEPAPQPVAIPAPDPEPGRIDVEKVAVAAAMIRAAMQ